MDVYHCIVWSGCDYFQCDREICFMCDGSESEAKVDGGRWMYVGSRVKCILVFRICVYECVYDVVCLYIGVLMCMHMSAYVCVCEHMCLLICMWWCRFGVDDGFGIMVLSGCREYVTEPVDVVLVVTGRVM